MNEMPSSLDAAWAAAEAAMPDGWRFSITPYWPSGYEAEAHDITRPHVPGRGKHGTGTTGPHDTVAETLAALIVLVGGRK